MHSSFPLRLISAVFLVFPALALAQGALTPPTGTPTPSMKSLDQLEPRTPLVAGSPGVNVNANGGFTIIESGSYYLTRNLSVATGSGIILAADNISLDLSGFTISSTSTENPDLSYNYYHGVLVESGRQGITIANGHIWSGTTFSGAKLARRGFSGGVSASGTTSVHISDITVTGVAYTGVAAGGSVDHCTVSLANTGVEASIVSNSAARECAAYGIQAGCATNCFGSVSSPGGIGLNATTAVGAPALRPAMRSTRTASGP